MLRLAFFLSSFLLTIPAAFAQVNIDTMAFTAIAQDLSLNTENGMVIIGETHDAKNTFESQLFLIRHLVANGYKKIFIEGGKSEAQILNLYLSSGDTSILKYTRAANENREFRTFIERICELNKNTNAGIVFYGFDFERPVCLNFLFHKWFENVITKDMGMNKNIEELLSIRDNGDRTFKRIYENSEAVKNVFNIIKADFVTYEKQYRDILKGNFSAFEEIVFNPSYFKSTGDMQRDKYMAEAMLVYEGKVGLNKAIVITGTFHIVHRDRFISRLLKKTKMDYATTVFIPVYKNCTMLDQRTYKFNSEHSLLRCLKDKPEKPLITFYRTTERFVPVDRKVMSTILVGFYDQ
jgi:hypothetical protein